MRLLTSDAAVGCCGASGAGLTRTAQVAVIEAARTLLGWSDANSEEFNKATTHPVVIFMPEGARPPGPS